MSYIYIYIYIYDISSLRVKAINDKEKCEDIKNIKCMWTKYICLAEGSRTVLF